MPDLLQTDARFGLPRGGRLACAPVAATNGLIYLAGQGWPRLVPVAADPVLGAIDVVRRIASSRYMNTSVGEGTSTPGFLHGLARYVEDHGYRRSTLTYAGWRAHPEAFSSGVSRPDLAALATAIRQPGAVAWMNVGWYRRGEEVGTWQRLGGHWLTVAGQGVDAEGRVAEGVWVLRDPSPRSGGRARGEAVVLEVATTGRLEGPQAELPQTARGVPQVLEGLALPPGADTAFVDGVVLLGLEPDDAS